MAKAEKKPPFTVKSVDDFDGDGVVIAAEIVKYTLSPAPVVRLTFNCGAHVTTVDLNPEDLGNMVWLIGKAQKAAIKSLVAK